MGTLADNIKKATTNIFDKTEDTPTDPTTAKIDGASPAQAAAVSTPNGKLGQRQAQLAKQRAAQPKTIQTAERLEGPRTTALEAEQVAQQKAQRLEQLGTMSTWLENQVSNLLNQPEQGAMPEKPQPPQQPTVPDPGTPPPFFVNGMMNPRFTDWQNRKTAYDNAQAQYQEQLTQYEADMQQYEADVAGTQAGTLANKVLGADDLMVSDVNLTDLGMDQNQLESLIPGASGMSLTQLQQAVEELKASELSNVEDLRSKLSDPMTSEAEKEEIRNALKDMGAVGLTGSEAAAERAVSELSGADEDQMKTDLIANIATDDIGLQDALENLEPDDLKAATKALAEGGADGVRAAWDAGQNLEAVNDYLKLKGIDPGEGFVWDNDIQAQIKSANDFNDKLSEYTKGMDPPLSLSTLTVGLQNLPDGSKLDFDINDIKTDDDMKRLVDTYNDPDAMSSLTEASDFQTTVTAEPTEENLEVMLDSILGGTMAEDEDTVGTFNAKYSELQLEAAFNPELKPLVDKIASFISSGDPNKLDVADMEALANSDEWKEAINIMDSNVPEVPSFDTTAIESGATGAHKVMFDGLTKEFTGARASSASVNNLAHLAEVWSRDSGLDISIRDVAKALNSDWGRATFPNLNPERFSEEKIQEYEGQKAEEAKQAEEMKEAEGWWDGSSSNNFMGSLVPELGLAGAGGGLAEPLTIDNLNKLMSADTLEGTPWDDPPAQLYTLFTKFTDLRNKGVDSFRPEGMSDAVWNKYKPKVQAKIDSTYAKIRDRRNKWADVLNERLTRIKQLEYLIAEQKDKYDGWANPDFMSELEQLKPHEKALANKLSSIKKPRTASRWDHGYASAEDAAMPKIRIR